MPRFASRHRPRRIGRDWLLAAVIVVISTVTACAYPATHLQTPTTLDAGEVQGALGVRSHFAPALDQRAPGWGPAPELSLRVGIADGWDLGFRGVHAAGLWGFELGVKHQVIDGDIGVAVAPAFVTTPDTDSTMDEHPTSSTNVAVVVARLPVFIKLPKAGPATPWIAPAMHAGIYVDETFLIGETWDGSVDTDGPLLAGGLSVGVKLDISDAFAIQPQIGILVPFTQPEQAGFVDPADIEPGIPRVRLGRGDVRLEAALGFFLDSG